MTTSNFFNWSSVRSAGLTMKTKTMKTKTLAYLCIAFACFMFIGNAKAQVTIGSGLAPEGGSLLDMKEDPTVPFANNATSTKGMLYPRVELNDAYRTDLHPMYDVSSADYNTNKANLKKSHTGLIVFNVTTSSYFSPGLYFWSGIEWRRMDDSPAVEASVTDLLCTNAIMSPSSYSTGVPFDGIVKIPYIGGTGGAYDGTVPIGGTAATNNLYIERIGGKLNYGGGEVMYRISGTPSVSSPTTTTFPINFLGKTCNVTVGSGVSSVNIKNLTSDAVISRPFDPNTDDSANANTLTFGEITITEAGSYAFSLRLYGRLSQDGAGRWPFYIYLQKNNKSTVIDAAEIDLVTVQLGHIYRDYSYSVTLGGIYEVGDKVIISMHKPETGPSWTLSQGPNSTSPVRTSLIYWKL
ncbi:MAG: hypothetical protein LBV71_18150 [Prevotella sp.]|jgi:hypothetical protein|nr:hypothetical protein [Prevotella sp.]